MRIFLVFVAVLGSMAAALSPAAAQPDGGVPPVVTVPVLEYTARILPNGARVYAILDTSSPTASINVWYNVGSRDDPGGRDGFAHLFEHLMFRTTRNLPQGVSPFITSIGGSTNASTHFDYTNYYITAPANQLEALIWLEGERLRNLVIDQEAFRAERDVVKEELRQRVFAQPYGRILYTLIPAFTFSTHPYARPIGGTIADLERASLADVRAFHETYYRPDNAIFVISGNFNPVQLEAWVDRYLGSIARPAGRIPRDARIERERTAPLTVDAFAPNVPLPAIVLSWHAPDAGDPDSAGLSLIEGLLTRGQSSRLRRALVDERQLASNLTAFNIVARDGHAFALNVTLAQGRDLAEAEAALLAEVARLRDEPVPAAELAAVKSGILGDALLRRETPRGRAFELGGGVALTGDPRFEDRRLAAIRRMTSADVQRIARRWLADSRRVLIRYQDEGRRPAGHADPVGADISGMGPVVPPARRAPIVLATDTERQAPPAPGAAPPRTPPAIDDRRLANGMRLVVARSSDVPLVTLRLVISLGDYADPAGKAGLADLMAALVLRGAGGRDAGQLAEAFAALGGSAGSNADADAITITATVPAANAEAAGGLLADIVLRPTLAQADLDRVRRQQVDAIAVASRQPVQTAVRVLPTAIFAGMPYGAIPTATSLGAVDLADIRAAHHSGWVPHDTTLIVTGALTPDRAGALAERLFGSWQSSSGRIRPPQQPAPPPPAQVLVVDIPSAGQTAVVAGVPVAGRSDPAWAALRIANARLGGGQRGFLTQEIRVRRGLSYGAGSQLDARRDATLVMVATQTRNEAAVEVVGLVLEQLRRLSQEPIQAADVAERNAFLVNGLAGQTERTGGLADYLTSLVVTGAPLAQARTELLGERAPDAAAATAAAARYLRPDAATLVIVGDSRFWIEPLRQLFPQLRRVTAEGIPVD